MSTHTHLRGNTPLPRLGATIRGWGNPFVWENSPLDRPTPPLRRVGKGFEWPGKVVPLENYPWTEVIDRIAV